MFPIKCEEKKIVSATFLPILDYGDVVYQHAPSYLLSSLDDLYLCTLGALRFITDSTFLTHHCELCEIVAWPSLRIQRKMHWHLLMYRQFWVIGQIISVVLYKGLCL